jgi:hypothetical protein
MYTRIDETVEIFRRFHGRRGFAYPVLTILLLFTLTSAGLSDEVYFTSGYSETGVVIRETDDAVRFRTEMGMSTISREKISFIEKATPEENQLLLKKYREKRDRRKAEAEARKEAERKFEQEQIAKGLIKFEERWISPAEKEKILETRRQALEHRRKFDAEQKAKGLMQFEHIWVTPEHYDELKKMAPDIYQLYDEITENEELIDSLRSAMLNVSSLEEAEEFSKRIEEISEVIDKKTRMLDRLLKRADEIQEMSVTYEMPEEFLDAFPPEEEEEETEFE